MSPGRERRRDQEGLSSPRAELHPDVSEHPDAEERFREAAEAYEVLSKAETRGLYDRLARGG